MRGTTFFHSRLCLTQSVAIVSTVLLVRQGATTYGLLRTKRRAAIPPENGTAAETTSEIADKI